MYKKYRRALYFGLLIYGALFIAIYSFRLADGRLCFSLFDDAMITLRYAENVALGHGAVWNLGERVEGYSNPLLVVVYALFRGLAGKFTSILLIQILGIALVAAIARTACEIFRALPAGISKDHSEKIETWIVAGIITYFPLLFWSLLGMETGFLTLFLLLTIYWQLRAAETAKKKFFWLAGTAGALCYFCRPDALLLVGAVHLAYHFAGHRPSRIASTASFLAVIVASVALHVGWRLSYYGDVVPNTYRLKIDGFPLSARITNGLLYSYPYLFLHLVLIGLAGFGMRRTIPKPLGAVIGATWFTALAYQIYVGGDAWNYWRLVTPVFPLLWIGAVLVAQREWGMIRPRLAGAVLLSTAILANGHCLPSLVFAARPGSVRMNPFRSQVGITLNKITDADATIGLITAGATAYFAERRAIDFLGKCDRVIAASPMNLSAKDGWGRLPILPGHNKYDLNYSIRKLEPDFIETAVWGSQDLTAWTAPRYHTVYKDNVSLILKNGSRHVSFR